jgi:hypothetical protein
MRQTLITGIVLAALAMPGKGFAQGTPLQLGGSLPMRVSWTRTEVALATGFTAALLMDAGQTKGLARGGWATHREANPLLGPTPSVARINAYTAVAGLTVLGAAAVLPARARPWFLGAAFVLEALTVARNAHAGLTISLP